jgi:dTDP-4-amino-4,6-dideoxy-D-galactose acyltransferase
MGSGDICQYLDWDSAFFERRIARMSASRLRHEHVERALAWCMANTIDCLYFLADIDDKTTVQLAEEYGFHFVDIRVTLARQLDAVSSLGVCDFQGHVRPYTHADLPILRAIAKVSYRDSRFYFDSNLPPALCDKLYETWIEQSCAGDADAVLVAEDQAQTVGYISCHLVDQATGQIGLLGVAAGAHGKGIGQRLVVEALRWFVAQGRSHVTVVTQGRNIAAQRLYQRCGFLTRSAQLWYHRWFSRRGGTTRA